MKGGSIYHHPTPLFLPPLQLKKAWNSENDPSYICGDLGSRPGFVINLLCASDHQYSFIHSWLIIYYVADAADTIEGKIDTDAAFLVAYVKMVTENGVIAAEVVRNCWLCGAFWNWSW